MLMVCHPVYITTQKPEERVEEALRAHAAASEYPLHWQIPYLIVTEGAAVVVDSGIRDGFYAVYATTAELPDWGRRIVRIEVDFLEHVLLATVPLELPDALGEFLRYLGGWLPNVEGEDAADFLRRLNPVLTAYEGMGHGDVPTD